ncbi:MAG TPA: U32 family peptidase [Clostridiales bacterium]|nr:U32 family peptidase [Clostridiales bacterium]HQP69070.1 U32 family peptidase [Clostridiales bacterium]
MKEKIKLELLSPAKDHSTGVTAILSGADAVYIGGPDFSARSSAGNSWEDIKQLCDFAHQFYAKVYVAINTIFFNGEEGRVQNSLDKAYKAGADAIIIQDMGILKLSLPPIPIIASTQCHNISAEQVKFLEVAGFSRAILARELSFDQIIEIKKNTERIELESFIHGALCVSYSGRCYFSLALSGRSANRGKCMQVCRLPFDLIDSDGDLIEKNKYLLSPRDFNLSGELEKLIEAGITSFKIEGRLKDASYVGNVTAFYSKELDKIIADSGGKFKRASSGREKLEYEPDLSKSFNRGFTKYFINGRKETVISESGQKSIGEFIGKVKELKHDHFTLDRKHDLKNGDGICWTNGSGELDGININTVEGDKIFPNRKFPHSAGLEIFRNENPAFEKAVTSGAERRIGVLFDVTESGGQFKIKASDEDGNSVELHLTHEKTPSQNPDSVLENWKKQFSKTGDTIFYLQDLNYKVIEPYFVPVSVLNSWRRELLSALLKERIKNYPRKLVKHTGRIPEFYTKHVDSTFNVANKYAEKFYEDTGAETVEKAYETLERSEIETLMTTKHCLKFHIGACPKFGGKKKFKEPFFLVLNGNKYRLEFDCGKCEMRILSPEI